MGYFIILIMSWLDSLISKGKGIILTLIAFAWMAYLGGAASPNTTLDYAGYQYYYDLLVKELPGNRLEWLYTSLSEIAISHNFEYAEFRLWLICVTFIILFIAVLRLTEKPIVFAALFLIFPFFNEVTQVRSFVAYSLVLFGLSFLKKLTIMNIIIFEFIVWLGIGFHSSAAIFVLIPVIQFFVQKVGIKKASHSATVFTIIFSLVLLVTSRVSVIVNLIASMLEIIAGSSVSITFINLMNHSSNRKTFFLIALLSYAVFQWYLSNIGNELFDNDKQVQVPYAQYSLLIMGEMLLPLLLLSDQLQRFQRIGIEGGLLIVGTLFLREKRNKDNTAYIFIIKVLIFVFISMYIYYGLTDLNTDFPNSIPYIAHLVSES
ncbi:EpsG family protein [Leuconostoc gasicomitatum]|uniref:EpsG family protein n=1 Tax=Leuconostoc gasicomitatum TaxID=115778 RepID=A0A9Q3XTS0_9LACO|nr:EpsG family protein [Leuconostoc gasicomitatum]MBZ5963224.1 EpsG family protein [Leuconostoc gasicomitatum]